MTNLIESAHKQATFLLLALLAGCDSRVYDHIDRTAKLICDGSQAYISTPTGKHWGNEAIEVKMARVPNADERCKK